jgi:hypothetical protein
MKKEKQQPKKKEPRKKIDYNGMWKGMPEFKQEEVKVHKGLIVHFMNSEDMLKFSKLVGQVITFKTRAIYYPEQKEVPAMDKRWVDKETLKTKKK